MRIEYGTELIVNRFAIFVTTAIAFVAVSSNLRAQPSGDARALATELFKQGRALMAAGDFAAACPKLAESQRLDPGGGTLLNLALCHEGEGKTATAWSELHEALGQARRDGRQDRVALASERIEHLEPKLCRLQIDIEHDVAALVVQRNGTPIGRAAWSVAMPVDPGVHRLQAAAPGYRAWVHNVVVSAEGTTVRVAVPSLTPAPDPQPAADPVPVTPAPAPVALPPSTHAPADDLGWSTGHVLGWVFGGLGIVSLGVGIGAGVVAVQKKSDADAACMPRCRADALALFADGQTAADVSTFWFATAAVSVATSVMLLVVYGGDYF